MRRAYEFFRSFHPLRQALLPHCGVDDVVPVGVFGRPAPLERRLPRDLHLFAQGFGLVLSGLVIVLREDDGLEAGEDAGGEADLRALPRRGVAGGGEEGAAGGALFDPGLVGSASVAFGCREEELGAHPGQMLALAHPRNLQKLFPLARIQKTAVASHRADRLPELPRFLVLRALYARLPSLSGKNACRERN